MKIENISEESLEAPTLENAAVAHLGLYQLNGVVLEIVEEQAFPQPLALNPVGRNLFGEEGRKSENLKTMNENHEFVILPTRSLMQSCQVVQI